MPGDRDDNADLLVFVPTLNDFECIGDILAALARLDHPHRVLIIDDGSSLPFDAGLDAASAMYVKLPANFGLGVCTQVAIEHARRHGYSKLIRVDADGQHPVDRIPDLLAAVDAGDADLVIGSRKNHADGGGWAARLIKGYYALVARVMTKGQAPNDVNSGFFAKVAEVAQQHDPYL